MSKRASGTPNGSERKRIKKEEENEDGDVNMENNVVDLSVGGIESWKRPAVKPINPSVDAIDMQLVDSDFQVEWLREQKTREAVISMYGINMQGNSIVMHVRGFFPYFYIPTWEGFTQADEQAFRDSLNREILDDGREKGLTQYVLRTEACKRKSLWGYSFGVESNFLCVTVALPSLLATSRRLLERGISFGSHGKRSFQTYESNIAYILRFMVDKAIVGGGWVEVKGGKYQRRHETKKVTRAQLEIDLHVNDLIAHECTEEWLKMAPLRVLSFDIECAGRKGVFPTPDQDPIIQIANIVQCFGVETPVARNVFTLNTCASIVGSQVISNAKEVDLLNQWKEFFVTADPDIITGYNIVNFDLPYLLDRARTLKIKNFPYLGRITNSETRMKDSTFNSKAFGTRVDKEISIHGRVQFDLLTIIRRDYKLRSYTLNSVSAHFLNQQKEDVHHSIITDLQNGNDETRRRLAVYCIKDAVLPIRLMNKLMLLINYIEMARVTGVPINFLLTRGQQIKVISMLYRKCKNRGYLIPVREKQISDEQFEGATVLEPIKGFYKDPIATLDFASLYPSIMLAHNLCYTTLVNAKDAQSKLKPEEVAKTPNGDWFVKKSVTKGLLPEILEELLAARSKAKKDMKAATSEFTKAVMNGRQLALKISANSVYGFTGAQVGQLPCLAISSSVTGYGREMIEHTKKCVEETYTVKNGYAHDALVVYGDTDSVMVKFGTDDVAESMRLGVEAAALVTKEFISPISLEFEKIYFPFLLMNKKRYAGLYWTNPKTWDKMDTKGIETVRRDNCELVKNVVTTCLNKLLIDKSIEEAIDFAKQTISDLLQNRLDLSLLVISKSLGKSASAEDYTNKQAHVELAERMRKRDAATAPVVGDRVAYVIIKGAKGAPAYQKSEDPIYVLENDIPIDAEYYLENQLKKPLERLFEPIMGSVSQLFTGEHTRSIKITSSKAGGIMKFAVKTRTCMGCKVPLKPTEKAVCAHCTENEGDLYVKQIQKIRQHEELFSRLWTQCQRCQGSLHQDVLCTSRDCPIFYRRVKVQKDLQETHTSLERFSF